MVVIELEDVFGSPSPPPPSLLTLFVFVKSEDLNSDEDDDPKVKVDKDAVGGGIDAAVDGAVNENDEPRRDFLFISVGAVSVDPESTRENGTDVEAFSI